MLVADDGCTDVSGRGTVSYSLPCPYLSRDFLVSLIQLFQETIVLYYLHQDKICHLGKLSFFQVILQAEKNVMSCMYNSTALTSFLVPCKEFRILPQFYIQLLSRAILPCISSNIKHIERQLILNQNKYTFKSKSKFFSRLKCTQYRLQKF